MRESVPVLLVAGTLSALAGLVLEKQMATFTTYTALLVLAPAFVSSAGALGGLFAWSTLWVYFVAQVAAAALAATAFLTLNPADK